MAEYFLTNRAIEDLTEIWNYTYDVWSEEQATKYYQLLIESCQQISENTGVGKNYNQIQQKILGFKINKHIIFYQIISLKKIKIIRILHESMDLKSRIGE